MNKQIHKKEILRGNFNFSYLFKFGKYIDSKNIAIIFNNSIERKIGFAILNKIKGSVKRNKIKRQLREIYRLNKEKFPLKKTIMILVKKNKVGYRNLMEELLSEIEKIF